MNWITKIKAASEKIKKVFQKRATKKNNSKKTEIRKKNKKISKKLYKNE